MMGDKLNSALEEARERERRSSQDWQRELAEQERMSRLAVLRTQEALEGRVRQATREDYQEWLRGFLQKGGEITHVYEYPMSEVLNSWLVAVQDFTLFPLHGARSLQIIVPEGIKFLGDESELGHSAIYFMEGFRKSQGAIVPIYNDIRF